VHQCIDRHLDEFIAHQLDVALDALTTAAKLQREVLTNPPRTVAEILATLEQLELVRTATVRPQFAKQI
jgi:hypothetical protein